MPRNLLDIHPASWQPHVSSVDGATIRSLSFFPVLRQSSWVRTFDTAGRRDDQQSLLVTVQIKQWKHLRDCTVLPRKDSRLVSPSMIAHVHSMRIPVLSHKSQRVPIHVLYLLTFHEVIVRRETGAEFFKARFRCSFFVEKSSIHPRIE